MSKDTESTSSEKLDKLLSEHHFESMATVTNEAVSKIDDFRAGRITPIRSFSEKMNDKVMFLPGDQIVIGGRAGVGKSAFSLRLVKSFLDLNLIPILILYWSWEMKSWRQVLRLCSAELSLGATEILKPETKVAMEQVEKLAREFRGLPIYFRTMPANYKDWSSVVASACENFEGLVINVMDHTRLGKTFDERTEEIKITNFMNEGMYLKNRYSCINIFLSQLNRNAETNARNRYDMGRTPPVLSDFFGADSVAQTADHAMILHRPELYMLKQYLGLPTDNLLAVHILKQRDGWTGLIAMEHNLKHNQIWDAPPEKQPQNEQDNETEQDGAYSFGG